MAHETGCGSMRAGGEGAGSRSVVHVTHGAHNRWSDNYSARKRGRCGDRGGAATRARLPAGQLTPRADGGGLAPSSPRRDAAAAAGSSGLPAGSALSRRGDTAKQRSWLDVHARATDRAAAGRSSNRWTSMSRRLERGVDNSEDDVCVWTYRQVTSSSHECARRDFAGQLTRYRGERWSSPRASHRRATQPRGAPDLCAIRTLFPPTPFLAMSRCVAATPETRTTGNAALQRPHEPFAPQRRLSLTRRCPAPRLPRSHAPGCSTVGGFTFKAGGAAPRSRHAGAAAAAPAPAAASDSSAAAPAAAGGASPSKRRRGTGASSTQDAPTQLVGVDQGAWAGAAES